MLGMSRGTWGWLGVVGLAVGALVWQGCSDVQSPDGLVGGVATVAVAASAAPIPTITPTPEAVVEAGDVGVASATPMPAATAMSATVTPTPQPQYTPSPTAEAIVATGATVAPTQVAADSQELPTETPVSDEEDPFGGLSEEEISCLLTSSSLAPDPGFVSLDERILRSSVIVRATMRSVSAASREYTMPAAYFTPTDYFPMVRFTFDVHEYLKGSGGDVITADIMVHCGCGCPDDSEQEVIGVANDWISGEDDLRLEYKDGHWQEVKADRWWENRESIIFLEEDELSRSETSGQSDSTMYKFIPWNEYRYPIYNYASTYEPYFGGDEYSILSERNRVWLPTTATSPSASGASESRFMLGEKPKDLYPEQGVAGSSFDTEISLSDLKSRIKAATDLVKQGEGVEAYEECLRVKLELERIPWSPYSIELPPFQSGLRAGTVIETGSAGGLQYYGIYFFSGVDEGFFEIVLQDKDSDPYNGYYRTVKTLRPLAAGDYSVVYHQMPGILRPCIGSPIEAYTDIPTANWTIRAMAPVGTLHEAFFDPVAIGSAVGADSDNGALTPAAFSAAEGADAEIRRVDWESDVVKIEIANPSASLANHHIDFIALDSSTLLRLDFDDAAIADDGDVRTFSWVRCGRPWQAGDKLMLRISESPPDLAGATSRMACSNATPTQSATPMPTPTAQCSNGIAVPNPASNPGLVADCAMLLAAKDTLEGDRGNLNWSADVGISDWEGVGIDNDGVATLELSEYRLNGAIPPELGSLANLWILDLSGNQLTGEIPSELSNLANLSIVRLGDNQLAGAIPTGFGSLVNIWSLDLGGNQLTGGIPSELGNLFNLEDLDLGGNQLTGEIPSELGNLAKISDLYLDNNRLTGEIPPELGDIPYPYLLGLTLSNNQFTGCIPDSLFSPLNHRDEVNLVESTSIWGMPFCDD